MGKKKVNGNDIKPLFISSIIVIVGLILILVGQIHWSFSTSFMSVDGPALLANLGSFLALIGSINFIYDMWLRRSFMDDVKDSVLGANNVLKAGIEDFSSNSKRYNFDALISKSKSITTVFNFSPRFLNDYHEALSEFLAAGGRLTSVFLAPDGKAIQSLIDSGYDKESINSNFVKIESAINALKTNGAKIERVAVDQSIMYACVIFDNDGFFIFSTSSSGRKEVPLIHFRRGGELWRFIENDIAALTEA